MNTKNIEDFDELLVEQVETLKHILGSDSEKVLIFCNGEDEGLMFDFTGTPNDIRKAAEKAGVLVMCLQHPEIAVALDTSAHWIMGGIALTCTKLNFYFSDEVGEDEEYFSLNTEIAGAIVLFAIQVSPMVTYSIELKETFHEESIGLCVFPKPEEDELVHLNLN